jgi:hypothetical protein
MNVLNSNTPLRMRFLMLAGLLIIFLQYPSLTVGEPAMPYIHLLEVAGSGDLDAPFYALGDFETGFDPKIHATNLEYLKTNPDLLEQIRTDLGNREFQWRLKSLSHRLLYASETRSEYIIRFESYCKDVIKEVLHVLELPNPYAHIVTLTSEAPSFDTSNGFNAYIVHNLAKEYQAIYEFSNTSEETIVIELSGQYATGEVGAYSSSLTIGDDGEIYFIHDTHTIWQNNAKNPYTVLMTPVEETLHILLRESTEAAIKRTVENRGKCSFKEAEKIVADWISVEEAIVGGLVYHLLPPILEKQVGPIPESIIDSDIKTKEQFIKYNKLRKGIRLVETKGTKTCLELYLETPEAIRDLLI